MKKDNKIRVLLAGYVNNINAQDLNCRALAMFLDKNKFSVSAFLVPQEFRDFDIGEEMNGVNLIQLHRPAKILWYWIYLKGIWNCDVAYFPKGQKRHWCKFLCKLFRKKSFLTVEGVIDGTNYEKLIKVIGSQDKIVKFYNYTDKTFSITQYMAKRNEELHGIRSDNVLYLGVDFAKFNQRHTPLEKLSNIVFIGNNMRYKGITEIFKLAKKFSDIKFHIVGGGMGYDVPKEIDERKLKNVIYHGTLNHDRLQELLQSMDLHIFPSRSEGFPKVTLETAAAGVPSIVYSDYGAEEWIENGKSGFVVKTFDQIVEIVNKLQNNPQLLQTLSQNAIKMAKKFDWRIVVKSWERTIEDIYNEK